MRHEPRLSSTHPHSRAGGREEGHLPSGRLLDAQAKTPQLLLSLLSVRERQFKWQEGVVVRAWTLQSDGTGFKSRLLYQLCDIEEVASLL